MSRVTNKVHHPLYAELAAVVGPTYTSDEYFVRLAYSLPDQKPGQEPIPTYS
jgi:hypothetical protein